ncbi:MAG: gliding motility-associated C-terminal domain-containing protein [Bacteroidota bacterium]
MKHLICICIAILWLGTTSAQSLLPDGSFEITNFEEYLHPQDAFLYLQHWYPANKYTVKNPDNGTPDLFDESHTIPINGSFSFWNIARGAADGAFHTGIANFFQYEGFLSPETVGTALTAPLEADAYYQVSLTFRNKGISGLLNPPIFCVQDGFRNIELLLDRDSAFVVIDAINKTSYSDASKQVRLYSTIMEGNTSGGWQQLGTCFRADGGERFFAATLQLGTFEVDPPCMIHEDHWDAFYIYYFDIDHIQLTKLPERIQVQTSICQNRRKRINIHDMAELPLMQNEIIYEWEDGVVDSVNYVSTIGTHRINAQIDCTTIPIELEVTGIDCGVKTYVPNAFSPNEDGENDFLSVFLASKTDIVAYHFRVYDRWGAMVFESTDSSIFWDGRARGKLLAEGIYTWMLSYQTDDPEIGIVDHQASGNTLLIH